MNLRRATKAIVIFAIVGLAMTVAFIGVVKTHHDEKVIHVEQREQQDQAKFKRQRKLAYPQREGD